jgi:peptide/nickel transport system substrate-binding protein
VLLQESLAQIGVKAQINKIPGANWRAALLKRTCRSSSTASAAG